MVGLLRSGFRFARMRGRLSFCAVTVGLLTACGGGGGGGGTVPSTPNATPSPVISYAPGTTPTPGPTGSTVPGVTPSPSGSTGTTPIATPIPTATPSPIAYTLPASGSASRTNYSIASVPSGLPVTLNGTPAGTTPLTLSPNYSAGAYTIAIQPSNASAPMTFSVPQNGSVGSVSTLNFVYNQVIDTAARITNGTSTAAAVRRASVENLANRPAQSSTGRPTTNARQVAVTYNVARVRGTFDALEHAAGFTTGFTASQSSNIVTRVVSVNNAASLGAATAALRQDASVLSVNPVHLRYPLGMQCSVHASCYADDPYLAAAGDGKNGDQWYAWLINAIDAWGYVATNANAPIAVIDTGFDPRQTEVASLVRSSEKVLNGYVYNFNGAATDTDGHGTYLSAVADAAANNGAGFAGIAFNAPLLEYKITDDVAEPGASTADEAQAIRDAVAAGAKVILLALGGPASDGPDPVESDAIAYAIAHNVTVVAGSGNDRGTSSALDFPAGYSGVISVGASIVNDSAVPGAVTGCSGPSTCNSEAVASYSNVGPGLGLVAPGGQGTGSDTNPLHWIASLWTTQPLAGNLACTTPGSPADCRVRLTGTSAAAAQVAGAVAMMRSVNPALTPAQTAQILYGSTDDIKDSLQGHGRLNAQRAVAIAAGDQTNASPSLPTPRNIQFVGFAYSNSGAVNAAPTVLDAAYPRGVPVASDGRFRIADIPSAAIPAGGYKIGVWLDADGDGKVDQGDTFGSTGTCSTTTACSGAGSITVAPVSGLTFTLP